MPYVPPHKRAGETKCTPESMSSSSSSSSSKTLIPQLRIGRAPQSIFKLLVVGNVKLKFEAFEGESFPHLRGTDLYVATPARHCDPEAGDDLSLSMDDKLEVTDRSFPALPDRIHPELTTAINQVGYVMKLVLRFGRMLFNTTSSHGLSASRSWTADSLSEVRSFSPDMLERGIRDKLVFGMGIMKTFDTSLSADFFNEVQQLAMQGSPPVAVKHRFIFRVLGGERTLKCVCYPAENNNGLVLKKLKTEPLRHMVADVLCSHKKVDLRVMLFSETSINLHDLPDEEQIAIQALVDAAVIDEHVKGSLHWPLGIDTRGNLSVGSAEHRKVTTITGKDVRWKFQVANRGELRTSTGRLSHEIDIKPLNWKDNLASGQAACRDALHTLLSESETCI